MHRGRGRQLRVHGDAVERLARASPRSTPTRATSPSRMGQTTGTLTIASGNGEDVYNDATSLTATITGASGGNFENLVVGTATATAHVNDTITDATVNLSASTVLEGAVANYVFTATLSNASQGVTTIHTDQGDITIADGQTTGTLTIAVGQRRGRLQRRHQPDGDHHRRLGRQFREPGGRHRGTATAHVNDTITDATVNLSASTVHRGCRSPTTCSRRRCRTPRRASPRSTPTRATSPSRIGQTTGTLTIASGNGEDVYNDASQPDGDHHRRLGRQLREPGGRHRDGDRARQRHHHRRDGQPERLDGASRVPVANYVFTATLSNASQGVTTIHTDQGDITIADGADHRHADDCRRATARTSTTTPPA